MRLAISNIAWDVVEDEAIAQLLCRNGIDAVDVAPGKYFPDLFSASDEKIKSVKGWWAERGIEITGMQALLFGSSGLNMFGSTSVRNAMLMQLAAVCRVGGGLGATRVVFGSPKNRDRTQLTDQETIAVAVPFFRSFGDIAADHGVFICLEPNPSRYGANFMLTSAETARVVELVAHPSIKMQLDTGALTINQEKVDNVLDRYAQLIGHIHASEPDLLPLGDGGTDHSRMRAALAQHLPGHVVSIEMVATKEEAHIVSIERALKFAIFHYRTSAAEVLA